MILESGLVDVPTPDLLSGGRLSNIPYYGTLTIQVQSDENSSANHADLNVQLPNGDVPVDFQRIPGTEQGNQGVLDTEELLQMSFNATQGGHFTIGITPTGTAVVAWRVVLTP